MKRLLLTLLYVLSWICPVAYADGLIVVHEIVPTPSIFPPPWPGPRPRRPPFVPPPRPYTFAPLEVKYHHVEVKIDDQVAMTAVDQEFYNPNDRQLDGTYLFPLPHGAHIDKFSLEVDGRRLEAELLAADKARQIYEDVVRRHRDPALLEYAGRDLFKVRIFPIEPRRSKRVRLSYTELLKTDSGVTRYVYPLNTEKYSAKTIPSVSVKLELESSGPLKTVYSPSHNVEVRRHGDRRATVGFEVKDVKPDTDFVLLFSKAEGDVGITLLTHRTATEDGYFLLLATPSYLTDAKNVVAKDLTFVLDTSGSMAGRKLDQAKKAITYCIESLNEDDQFEIVSFATEAAALFGRLAQVTRSNRDRAEQFVRDLKASGGTAIYDALKQALSVHSGNVERPYYVILLTDGLPTVGETDNDRIIAMVRDSSSASNPTRVFCFGIGTDVNTHLLDRITETTRAASAYVFPDEDIEVKVSSFFTKINEPVLTNVKLRFPDAVRVTMLHPQAIPDLFKGEQLILVGRYSGNGTGIVTVEGTVNGNHRFFQYEVEFPELSAGMDFVPRLWATRRIGYLLDEIRLRGENAELRDEIVELARKHGIVTPYTAYLIHEDEQRRNVPMTMRSFPQLESDQQLGAVVRDVYKSYVSESTGGSALAAANYVSSQKTASQVDHALQSGAAETTRAIRYRLAAAHANANGSVQSTNEADAADQFVASTQQAKFVGGRTFFFNGDQWIDYQVQIANRTNRVRIQFGSKEYFDLLSRHPEVGQWLALGQKIQFVLGSVIYEVTE